MEKVTIELEANSKNAEKEIDKVNESLKRVEQSSKKTSKELSGGAQIGNEGVKALDKSTGGLATKFVAVGKAAKLSGKAMKTALISSGIGVAVVLIGLIVEHWDSIFSTVTNVNKRLEEQKKINEQNLTILGSELTLLEKQMAFNTARGISNKENLATQKLLLKEKRLILDADLKILEAELLKEQSGIGQLSNWDNLKVMALNAAGQYAAAAKIVAAADLKILKPNEERITKILEQINKLKGEVLDVEDDIDPVTKDTKTKDAEVDPDVEAKAKAIEAITKLEDDYFQSQLDKQTQEENAVRDKYFNLIEQAEKYKLDTTELEAARLSETQAITDKFAQEAKDKKILDDEEAAAIALEIKEASAITEEDERILEIEKVQRRFAKLFELAADDSEALIALKKAEAAAIDKINEVESKVELAWADYTAEQKLGMISDVLGQAASLVDKDSAAGKAIAVAKTGINTAQGIVQALGNLPPPISYVAAAFTGAMGLMNTKKILTTPIPSATGKGNVSGGGGGGSLPSIPPTPPSFNIVGQSDTNQLADAIGGQEQVPVQAFVVSSDVTSAQELDRNIIDGASI